MIRIVNDGQEIVSTDYWASEDAQNGFMYLSGNDGAWRLLVPESAGACIGEMAGAKWVSIEESIHLPGLAWDIVFEDGSDCWCRSKFDPPCRLNFDPGLGAGIG